MGRQESMALNGKLVAEGANGPCNPEGERVLLDRGIDLLPDILANSGGVTVSYYEWVQNKRSEHWTLEEVDERLESAMKRAYREVSQFARSRRCDMRVAAYALALSRLEGGYNQREIFPRLAKTAERSAAPPGPTAALGPARAARRWSSSPSRRATVAIPHRFGWSPRSCRCPRSRSSRRSFGGSSS